MDFSTIKADPVIGNRIGELYLSTEQVITDEVRSAYRDFAFQVLCQYREMRKSVRVVFQPEDPYGDAEEMFRDVRENGMLRVYMTTPEQSHPLMSWSENDRFRAVHDYYGHFMTGRGFDRHGEEAAWVKHSQMFFGPARRAMTTETRGQSSAFIWRLSGSRFPAQKAILLPEWVSEVNPHLYV